MNKGLKYTLVTFLIISLILLTFILYVFYNPNNYTSYSSTVSLDDASFNSLTTVLNSSNCEYVGDTYYSSKIKTCQYFLNYTSGKTEIPIHGIQIEQGAFLDRKFITIPSNSQKIKIFYTLKGYPDKERFKSILVEDLRKNNLELNFKDESWEINTSFPWSDI